MTDKEAIEKVDTIIQQMKERCYFHGEPCGCNHDDGPQDCCDNLDEFADSAISALKERDERSKGCECCIDLEGNSLPARQDRMFCPKCGRKLKTAMPGEEV